MKKHILLLAFVIPFSCWSGIYGQTVAIVKRPIAEQYRNYENRDASLSHLNFFEETATQFQLSAGSEMQLQETIPGENGYTHFKYQQSYQGLPIFGGTYILHEKNGVIERATGNYVPNVQVATQPKMSAKTALSFAKQHLKADEYAEEQPLPILCLIDKDFPKQSGTLKLAYQVELTSTEPYDKRRIFVDAMTGKLLTQFPLILREGVPSKAHTRYYGVKDIVTDSLGPNNFKLHDPTRGEGITIFNSDLTQFSSTSSTWDLTNAAQDEVALDAHYCSQEYYDMMLESFAWDGLDGNGMALKVQVHNNGAGEVNAFWDGEYTNYGDGNCIYGPLTTLEVVGHEFAHGFTQHTSKLVYAGESGAINESMSDMFGKMLERKTDPANFDWDLGHSFLLTPEAKPFRVMDDPASVGMPDFYKGELWEDYSGVHTNSAVGNLWFTMIVDGRQGTNEIGEDFNVPALGIDKAGQIAFLTNRAYLTENSNYNDFYTYSMQAVAELFGNGSLEQQAVQEAWKAVGLPASIGPSIAFDLGLSSSYEVSGQCGLNQFYPISFEVKNHGSQSYEPSMGAFVTLVDNDDVLPDYIINLDQAIEPGEAVVIMVDDWFYATEPGVTFLNIELNFPGDEVFDNDYSWNAFDISPYSSNDLSLTTYYETTSCFSKNLETTFNIFSESCEPIPAGTSMAIKAFGELGALIWSTPYELAEELQGFGLESYTVDVDLSALQFGEAINFRLEYGSDPNLDNNEFELEHPFIRVIDGDYLNNFSVEPDDAFLDVLYYFPNPIVTYQSQEFFASTGLYEDAESLTHCPDFESNFESEFWGGINATIRACLDYSASQTPTLEFDMALFKNEIAESEGYPYSSMLQAKWTGSQDGEAIIYDQAEGEVTHHTYQLPANFKGELKMKFYTEVGKWEIDPANFSSDDFVLLDNLRLSSTFTDAVEKQQNAYVKVSPNPTEGDVLVQSNEKIAQLSLLNLNGQPIRQMEVGAERYSLDLSVLTPGFYLLKTQLANGFWISEKLIKI